MARGYPSPIPRPAIRLKGVSPGLGVGVAFENTNVRSEVVATHGSARIRARIKTAAAGGTIQLIPLGPDYNPETGTGGTEYTSGVSASTAVVAATEMNVDLDLYGENFVLVKFVGSGTGTITYCDVSQV